MNNTTLTFELLFFVFVIVCRAVTSRYHASFTAYEDAKSLWKSNPQSFNVENCEAIQLILYSRHASRYPGRKSMNKITQYLPKIRQSSLKNLHVDDDIKNIFRHWFNQYNPSVHHTLTETGREEMFELGKRYNGKFQNLFGSFSADYHEYRSTAKERTEESAFMFARGAHGISERKDFEMLEPLKIDPLLRFYKSCDKWIKEVDKSKRAHVQEKEYLVSEAYLLMMNRVRERLFPHRNRTLSHDEIKAIYAACVFDYLINQNRSSPWCSVFDSPDLRVLEFWEDIEHYWTDGYPYSITYKQACRPVKDIINNFRLAINGTKPKKTVLRFTHLGFMLKLFARFQLFNDHTNLTSTMMNHGQESVSFKVRSRQYRMSKIGPMASHIAFVLYKCQKNYRVKAFVQESEVKIGGCPQATCTLQRFLHEYQEIAENCDVEGMCKL